MPTETKKTKALELAITQIDRQFGKGSIMRLGDNYVPTMENVISRACSPVSGWEINNSSVLTPNFLE